MNKKIIFEVGIVAAIAVGVFLYERYKKKQAAQNDDGDLTSQYDETDSSSLASGQPLSTEDFDTMLAGLAADPTYNTVGVDTGTSDAATGTTTANTLAALPITPYPSLSSSDISSAINNAQAALNATGGGDPASYVARQHMSPLTVAASQKAASS